MLIRRTVAGVLAVVGLLALGAPDAGAAVEVVEVEGSAFGILIDVEAPEPVPSPPPSADEAAPTAQQGEATPAQIPIVLGPVPTVTLPPEGGGPITDSFAGFDFGAEANATFRGDLMEVSTEGALGPDGFARSSATVADFIVGEIIVRAALVDVGCESTATGPTGSTALASLDIPTAGINDEDLSPDPNTVIPLEIQNVQFGQVTLNRQVVDGNRIEVTGMMIELTDAFITGTIEVGQAVCGVTTAEIPEAAEGPIAAEPSFAG